MLVGVSSCEATGDVTPTARGSPACQLAQNIASGDQAEFVCSTTRTVGLQYAHGEANEFNSDAINNRWGDIRLRAPTSGAPAAAART